MKKGRLFLPGLSDEARRALRSFDAQHQPPDDARAANYAAVMRRVRASAPVRAPRAMRWWPVAGLAAAAALVLVAAAVRTGRPTQQQRNGDNGASLAPSTAHAAPERERVRSPAPRNRAVPEPKLPAQPMPEAEPLPPAPPRPSPAARSTRHREPAAPAPVPPAADPMPDLARESALILQARTALAQGRLEATKRSLLEHRAEFPQGALVEERRAFEAEVACRRGDPTATDRLGAFRRQYPESTLQSRVEAACNSMTETAATSQEG